MITELASLKVQIFSPKCSVFKVKTDLAECTIGMVAALDLCLAFVEYDSTAKVHERQEVNHDCVKCREMASGTFSVEVLMHGPTCSCMYCTWPSSEAMLSGGLLQRAV